MPEPLDYEPRDGKSPRPRILEKVLIVSIVVLIEVIVLYRTLEPRRRKTMARPVTTQPASAAIMK